MATTNQQGVPQKGTVGNLTHYRQSGEHRVRTSTNQRTRAGRTAKNMASRTLMANVNNAWKVLGEHLSDCFMKEKGTDFHRFLSANRTQAKVRLARQEAQSQCCVADHFLVSAGSLRSIEVRDAGEYWVSDIPADSIDERFQEGDYLRFLRMTQRLEGEMPYADATCQEHRIGEATPAEDGFLVVDGFYACKKMKDSLVAWIHLYRDESAIRTSTQCLIGENSLLAQYTGDEALARAIASYPAEEPQPAKKSQPAQPSPSLEARLDRISQQLDRIISLLEKRP